MPPRRGIVKSGNAGNSSKPSGDKLATTSDTSGPKSLFPAGYKYPLSLLSERCQKNGWEKPSVDTPRKADGYSFVVTLSRLNKKSSQTESIRLEPHPPKTLPTPLEARHWGATYALYRFCNNIQLHLQLPPGPREYWNDLAAEHKIAPDHQKWMYDSDPFSARKVVDERQARATQRAEQSNQAPNDGQRGAKISSEFTNVPEVRMATTLRDMVEASIKKAFSLYPEVEETIVLSETDKQVLQQQLAHLGFKPGQCLSVLSFLSTPSAVSSALLRTLSPLEASIEYLILHVPECDLPERFLPESNSSNAFVRAAHSGTNDLKRRWMAEKAIKEAGWPVRVVEECMADPSLSSSWEQLIRELNQRLVGDSWEPSPPGGEETETSIKEELDSIDARYVDDSEILVSLFMSPLKLHVILPRNSSYPSSASPPPMYITCNTVPAYIKLHLLARLVQAFRTNELIQSGEGFFVAALRFLEDGWGAIEDRGPPDVSVVLEHLLRPSAPPEDDIEPSDATSVSERLARRSRLNNKGTRRVDQRTDAQIKQDLESIRRTGKYNELLTARERLPAFKAKDEFLEKVEKNRVVVVVGETGSGKTTQLPQFILDSLILTNRGSKASILVTQPRRISAISVATRVSAERVDDGSVGYAIRGESKQDARTKLLFCTTGVVLRRLSTGDDLHAVTHVIVDEVHERTVDGDFLLLQLKELLSSHPTLKVILMSATINHETFIKYFDGAPLLSIPGFAHPVTDVYLEEIIPVINYRPPSSKPIKKESESQQRAFREEFTSMGLDDQSVAAIQNLSRSGRIDYQLIAATVSHIISTARQRAGILIFLPGVQEIRQCVDALSGVLPRNQAHILPLHANLSSDEQRLVFAPTSKWKIVAATNVAETSITIDDIVYVVDAGKVKETQYDHESGLSKLVECWVTRAAARQRRGRAGRTQPGFCYKLYTRKHEDTMEAFPTPEILRVPLERLSLTVKVMREEEDVKHFLSRAIDPPDIAAMDSAWSVLEDLGAVNEHGGLTALGRHISMLPVDLRLAKMLVLGSIFQCLGPILDVAACLSSKPVFLNPMDKREEATQARARFATDNSDLLTDVRAYTECARVRSEGKSPSAIKIFCEENFISVTTIREITTLRQDFLAALSEIGFIPLSSKPSDPALNTNSSNSNLIKAVILGGLWPRIARVSLPKSAIKFDRVQAGTVQRSNTAKEFKMYDLREGRVFLHPASVLFGATSWKSPFLTYFQKQMTSKPFLRDATEVPLYALLLFGGHLSVDHVKGGLTITSKDSLIKLKAWPRIGVMINQLRRLLDAQLQRCIEEGSILSTGRDSPALKAILALLKADGMSD